MAEYNIRRAVAGDLAFLEDMLVEAANAPARVRGRLHDRGDARRGGSSGGLVHVWHGEAHRYARAAGGRGALV
jgi:hypothetical protein